MLSTPQKIVLETKKSKKISVNKCESGMWCSLPEQTFRDIKDTQKVGSTYQRYNFRTFEWVPDPDIAKK